MSSNYFLMIHFVHSVLQTRSNELVYDDKTTVESFRKVRQNEVVVMDIFNSGLKDFNYEISWNQTANGIHLFLKSKKLNNVRNDEPSVATGDAILTNNDKQK